MLLKHGKLVQWILLRLHHIWPLCIWQFAQYSLHLSCFLGFWRGHSALCLFSPVSFSNPSLDSLFCPLSKYLFHLGYCSWTCSWLYSYSNQHHSFSWNLWSAIIMQSEFPSATSVLSSNLPNISSWLLTVICSPAFANWTHPEHYSCLLCVYVSEHFRLASGFPMPTEFNGHSCLKLSKIFSDQTPQPTFIFIILFHIFLTASVCDVKWKIQIYNLYRELNEIHSFNVSVNTAY